MVEDITFENCKVWNNFFTSFNDADFRGNSYVKNIKFLSINK